MKKRFFIFILCLLHVSLAFCQQNDFKPFTLSGTVNKDTGTLTLNFVGDSSLYPAQLRHLKATIKNGKFTFNGEIPHPMGYKLQMDRQYVSDLFVVEPGVQMLECNIDSSRKIPEIKNKAMLEHISFRLATSEFRERSDRFTNEFGALRNKYPKGIPDTLKAPMEVKNQALYDEGDRLLLAYIKENPGSYWALWRLSYLAGFGYEKIFSEMMPLFADSLKNSYSGKRLGQILKKSSVLSVGNKFPHMELLQVSGDQSAGIPFTKSKYTLVDFWYTNCGPCIGGFPSLVKIYSEYHVKGFEIAGIATDALKYKKDLPIVIKKHKLKWLQYWDLDGTGATELSILAFPTNYLLDENGIIIQKNIRSAELAAFLKKYL